MVKVVKYVFAKVLMYERNYLVPKLPYCTTNSNLWYYINMVSSYTGLER